MDPELRDILERPEGHRLDFKRTDALDHNRKLAQHLVAFANRYGGKLVFGVTDDGELEGSDIDEESALRSLRSISRIRCNPPVNFEEKLYQEVSYEGRTGDILVVDISPKQASPHAVVPGGNNEERSFYIRTADESRLIKDSEELRHLFVNDPDPSFKEVLPTAIVHKLYTYEPIRMRRSLPGWLDYRLFLNRLTDDDRSFLKSQDTGKDSETLELQPVEDAKEDAGSIMVREVFPAILFDSFRRQTPDFWIDRVVSNDDEYEVYMQHTEHLSFDDLVKSSNQSILPQLSLNLDRVFHTNAPLLRVPLGTEAVIRAHNQSECPSCLTLKIENKFQVDIELSLDRGTTVLGIPKEYPGTVAEPDVYTREYDIHFRSDFGFPDVEDSRIHVHRAFAKGILEFVKHRWDIQEYEKRQPPRELYEITERLDSIESKLSACSEANSSTDSGDG